MASPLLMSFTPSTTRVYAATSAKGGGGGGGGSKEEKSFLDWVLGNLQKQEQFYETDPILKKVEESGGGTAVGGPRNSVALPKQNKGGGFGGLFSKK